MKELRNSSLDDLGKLLKRVQEKQDVCKLGSSATGWGPVASFCDHSNEHKFMEFLDQPNLIIIHSWQHATHADSLLTKFYNPIIRTI
jgi:hypothetical protein